MTERYILDFSKVADEKNFHEIIKKQFNLEDYYSHNLDSLWDLLTERDSLYIIIKNKDYAEIKMGNYGIAVLALFEDLRTENKNYNIIYIDNTEEESMIIKIKGKTPKIHDDAWASNAVITGDCTLEEGASVWYNTVMRGDAGTIVIGKKSNVQDNSVVHVEPEMPVIVGENTTVGHNCILHGCEIGDNSLIGMGAIILNKAKIGNNCIVGAGALVTEGKIIPDNSLVVGAPARVVRQVTKEEIESITDNANHYYELSKEYKELEK